MNPFELKEKEVRFQFEVNDKLKELEVVPAYFQTIIKSLEDVKVLVCEKKKSPDNIILDNKDFIKLMGISVRTAQQWRDGGFIHYSQIGSKIYYRMSDVQRLLDNNYKLSVKLQGVQLPN